MRSPESGFPSYPVTIRAPKGTFFPGVPFLEGNPKVKRVNRARLRSPKRAGPTRRSSLRSCLRFAPGYVFAVLHTSDLRLSTLEF